MTHSVYRPGRGGGAERIGTIRSEKCILFTCEDESVYALRLKHVADVRAKYYAEKDPDTTYKEEFDYVMNDPYEGIDWFRNQQDPEDFTGKYELVEAAPEKTIEAKIKKSEATITYRELFVPKEEE